VSQIFHRHRLMLRVPVQPCWRSCILCYEAELSGVPIFLHNALRQADIQCWLAASDLAAIEDSLHFYRDCVVLTKLSDGSMPWAESIFKIAREEEKRREGSPVLIEISLSETRALLRHRKRYALEPFVDEIDGIDKGNLTVAFEKLVGILRSEDRKPARMFRGPRESDAN
jgi:hypothetical protein